MAAQDTRMPLLGLSVGVAVAQMLQQPMSRRQGQPLEMAPMGQLQAFLVAASLTLAAVAAHKTQGNQLAAQVAAAQAATMRQLLLLPVRLI